MRGRVVDRAQRPIPGAAVSWYWSANGIPRDDDGTPWPKDDAGLRKKLADQGANGMSRQVGTMEPVWTLPSATTDADGRFELIADRYAHVLIAMDGPRQRGALREFDPAAADLAEPLVLHDLVRVRGTLVCAGQTAPPKWTNVYVGFEPDAERRPLDYFRLFGCSSNQADFSFLVPPGMYSLELYSTGPEAQLKGGLPLVVDGSQPHVDLGALELQPGNMFLTSRIREWEAKGNRGNYKEHVGRAPPQWFISDARGASKDVQLADYRGKWVVLEFWNLSCTVCLKRSLPEWAEFYRTHGGERDRFEVLSICVDVDENLASLDQVEQKLAPIVKHVWHGQPLPFPMLLDSGLKTWQSYGLDFMAQTLLVDPAGNLTDVVGHQEVFERLRAEFDKPSGD